MKTLTIVLTALTALAACHHDAAKPVIPQSNDTPPAEAKKDAPPPQQKVDQDQKVSSGIALSGDIAQLCGIKPLANVDPKFDYDKDELTSDDRTILQQLATCMMTGPLKGKAVALIGRADPRGTEEYNLSLGSKRASSVGSFLTRLGVAQAMLGVTTRGALDATGTDEAGYRADRRVDVQLKS
jgi:peptidoglycan-associated lipoprotein